MKVVDCENENLENFYKLISKNVIRIRLAEYKHFNLEHLYKISEALEIDILEI